MCCALSECMDCCRDHRRSVGVGGCVCVCARKMQSGVSCMLTCASRCMQERCCGCFHVWHKQDVNGGLGAKSNRATNGLFLCIQPGAMC
jgi:hypothetical protein